MVKLSATLVTQALYNLGITQFSDKDNPESKGNLLKDIYADSDIKVLERMLKKSEKPNGE